MLYVDMKYRTVMLYKHGLGQAYTIHCNIRNTYIYVGFSWHVLYLSGEETILLYHGIHIPLFIEYEYNMVHFGKTTRTLPVKLKTCVV